MLRRGLRRLQLGGLRNLVLCSSSRARSTSPPPQHNFIVPAMQCELLATELDAHVHRNGYELCERGRDTKAQNNAERRQHMRAARLIITASPGVGVHANSTRFAS